MTEQSDPNKVGIDLKDNKVCLEVPFESNELAVVAKNSIDADQIPNPDFISRTITVDDNILRVVIQSGDLFKLRTSLNNYIESVLQIQKTIKRFNYDNYGVHKLSNVDDERGGDTAQKI